MLKTGIDKKQNVKRMFDSIAHRYDLLNHLLSAGVDIYWRKRALRLTKFQPNAILLDVACGTGDFAIEAHKQGVREIIGADFSYNMLALFNKKRSWAVGKTIQITAENIPMKAEKVTNITVAFGVRNFYDIPMAFKEFHRVLKPDGKSTILEFRMPTNPIIKAFYSFYFSTILPLIGKAISKDDDAYKYLPDSVEDFDRNVDLTKLFKEAGFSSVEKHSLTFGLVQVVIAQK